MNLPISWDQFVQLVATQAFIGALLSWFVEHVPFIQAAAVANWKKALFIVGVCILWAFIFIYVSQGSLPHDVSSWYLLVITAVSAIMGNQGVYKLFNEWFPGLADFLTGVLSKPAQVTMTTSTTAGTTASGTVTIIPAEKGIG